MGSDPGSHGAGSAAMLPNPRNQGLRRVRRGASFTKPAETRAPRTRLGHIGDGLTLAGQGWQDMRKFAEKRAKWTTDGRPPTPWHRGGEAFRERCACGSHACDVQEVRRRAQSIAPRSDPTRVKLLQCVMGGGPLKTSVSSGGCHGLRQGPATAGLLKLLRVRSDCPR